MPQLPSAGAQCRMRFGCLHFLAYHATYLQVLGRLLVGACCLCRRALRIKPHMVSLDMACLALFLCKLLHMLMLTSR